MTSRNQINEFEQKHTNGGLKELKYTITFEDGRRTPFFKSNELRMLETFAAMADVGSATLVEIDHDTGYYELGLDVLACNCGDGMRCEKVKVTPYD